ncbi:RHS repeat domain-containing protein [Microbacterium sp. NPDC087868]|uniref:RHS repeat domain-containing protein n=1 Tax=Microbacterium sp. NPDC087868 TaxID=3364195 RepID=UPI00384D2E96
MAQPLHWVAEPVEGSRPARIRNSRRINARTRYTKMPKAAGGESARATSWDVTGAEAGDSHLTAEFNAAGQLTSTKTTGANAGSASYSFDGAGNRPSQTVNGVPTSFGHDAAGRLLSTQTEGRSTSYAYDGLDRRTSVTDETAFGSDTTGTTWDGLDPVATDSGLHGATELLRDPTGEVVFQSGAYDDAWVLGDARNATATADAGGRITDLVDYADFGAAGFESTGWASLVGNDGQPGDATLRLDHYYARDYDTATGSWVQPDEWRGLLVRPQSLNRFAYVENSPVAFSDHLGYASKKGGFAAGFGNTNVKKSTTKGGLAAASAAMNMNSLANSVSKVVKSLPKGKVSNPSGESDDWTAASHPPCVYSYETCAGPVPLSSQGGPFSASPWTSEQWAAAGWIVGGALLVGLGIACIAATAGICGATILASAGAVAVTSAGTTAAAGAVSISAGTILGGVAIVGGAAAVGDGAQTMFNETPSGNDANAGGSRPSSPNQLNQQINRGQAPSGIRRVDTGKVTGDQQHVHFSNGAALNVDGTWKHGVANLTRDQIAWLQRNGWVIPRG